MDGDDDAVKGGAVASGLSPMEKEQKKITLLPNIYREESEQRQIENKRLSSIHLVQGQWQANLSGANKMPSVAYLCFRKNRLLQNAELVSCRS